MNGPEGFLPKNQNFTTQVARILWYRPLSYVLINILPLSGSSTCIQQSAPEGFFRNEDCRKFSNFVCELSGNAVFSEPPEGKVWILLSLYTFSKGPLHIILLV